MKKNRIFLGIFFMIVLGLGIFFLTSKSYNFISKNDNIKEVDSNSELDNEILEQKTQEDYPNVDNEVAIPESNSEVTNQVTENKEEETINKSSNDTKQEQTSQNNTEVKQDDSGNNTKTETPKENINSTQTPKGICTTDDSEYNNWLKDFLGGNKTVRIFTSLSEAKSFGNNAAKNYGFGYYFSPYPTKFEGSNCYADVYTVELYAAASDCGDNPIIYVDRDQPLMDVFRYLETKGYSCENKSWY